MSYLEKMLETQIRALKMPEPIREYRFGAVAAGGTGKDLRHRLSVSGMKDWRFDFCWPDIRFAVEVEGGGWVNGGHNRGKGFAKDLEKYHAAMKLGYTVYRCDGNLIKSGKAIQLIETIIRGHNG